MEFSVWKLWATTIIHKWTLSIKKRKVFSQTTLNHLFITSQLAEGKRTSFDVILRFVSELCWRAAWVWRYVIFNSLRYTTYRLPLLERRLYIILFCCVYLIDHKAHLFIIFSHSSLFKCEWFDTCVCSNRIGKIGLFIVFGLKCFLPLNLLHLVLAEPGEYVTLPV